MCANWCHFNFSPPTDAAHQYKGDKGSSKNKYGKLVTEKTFIIWKKGDVGMAKCFTKKYGNKGWAFNYLQSESYVKIPVSAWCYIPTSMPQEEAAKSKMLSLVRVLQKEYLFLCTVTWDSW